LRELWRAPGWHKGERATPVRPPTPSLTTSRVIDDAFERATVPAGRLMVQGRGGATEFAPSAGSNSKVQSEVKAMALG
jgi:hypothetical protein